MVINENGRITLSEFYEKEKENEYITFKKYWSEKRNRERIITAQQEQEKTKQRTLSEFYEKEKENEDGVRCVAFGGQWL